MKKLVLLAIMDIKKKYVFSDLVCGDKIDDCRFSANLRQFSVGSWLPMSTFCKCQKVQA